MNVGRKLMLIVVTSIALVTIPAAGGMYYYTKQKLLAKEASALLAETKSQATSNAHNLVGYELSLKALSSILTKTLSPPPQAGEEIAFDHLVQQYPDHAWRNQRKSFNGNLEASIFLPPNAPLDATQKSLHLRSKHILDIFGGSITSHIGNIWLLTHGKTVIIYDHLYPDFALLMPADNDYTKTPWVTLGDPITNPQRSQQWTPPLFDSVSKTWVVSVVLPLDVNKHWIGNIGRDISLSEVLPALFNNSQRYAGEYHFLLDAQGNFIEAGPWQKALVAMPINFKPDLRKEPDLKKLFATKLDSQPQLIEHEVQLQGHKYLAIGMTMQPVGWQYFRLVPTSEILAPMRQLFSTLVAMVLIIGLLIGLLIKVATKRNIVKRLQSLANTVRLYGLGELDSRAELIGDDEIASTSHAFNTMADNLAKLRKTESISVRRYETAMSVTSDGIHILDENGNIVEANQAFCDSLGYTQKEIKLLNVINWDTNFSEASLKEKLDRFNDTTTVFETQHRHKDGAIFDVGISAIKLFIDENAYYWCSSRNITERKQAEKSIQDSEFRWKFALEGAGDGVWDWNIQTDEASYSYRWKDMLGYAEDDILPSNDEWVKRIHPDDQSYVAGAMQAYLDKKTTNYIVEYRLRCKNDNYKWILGRGVVVKHGENGEPLRMIGTHTDISHHKVTEHNLRISAIAFEAQESMMVSDANKVILRVNKAFSDITGYSMEEVVGQTALPLRSKLHEASFYAGIWESVDSKGIWKGEIFSQRKNGEVYPAHLIITAVKDLNGMVSNYVTTLVDISVQKSAAREIEHLAFYDSLTDLPNRRLLLDRLEHALSFSARSGKQGALLFIDLDHFKMLNDSLGHDIGDLLLKQVAERMATCVRESDTIARLGGDEFVVILEDLDEQNLEAATQAETIANKILNTLNQPYLLASHEYTSTVSIGITLFSEHKSVIDDILKQADIAMYQSKKAGRNALCFFDPKMQHAIHARVDLERELRKALEQHQFQLHYQIQVDLLDNPIGAEALIRWIHPERGLISPLDFITVAEETGLILPIGQWVLEAACAQLKAWQHGKLTQSLTMSVNVSAQRFRQTNFAAQVIATVQRYAINPVLLKLELTESILLDDFDGTITTMSTLKELGIRFSLDDFGTGYSSLQYLKRLPLYQLKIDQSGVRRKTWTTRR